MLFISCRYANPDFDRLRMNRIRLNIYRERRNLCQATGANPASPKLFGNCLFVRTNRMCIHHGHKLKLNQKLSTDSWKF